MIINKHKPRQNLLSLSVYLTQAELFTRSSSTVRWTSKWASASVTCSDREKSKINDLVLWLWIIIDLLLIQTWLRASQRGWETYILSNKTPLGVLQWIVDQVVDSLLLPKSRWISFLWRVIRAIKDKVPLCYLTWKASRKKSVINHRPTLDRKYNEEWKTEKFPKIK